MLGGTGACQEGLGDAGDGLRCVWRDWEDWGGLGGEGGGWVWTGAWQEGLGDARRDWRMVGMDWGIAGDGVGCIRRDLGCWDGLEHARKVWGVLGMG